MSFFVPDHRRAFGCCLSTLAVLLVSAGTASGAGIDGPRGFELISPPDAGVNADILGDTVRNAPSNAFGPVAADGGKVLIQTPIPAPGVAGGQSASILVASRAGQGWQQVGTYPPATQHQYANISLNSITADFEHVALTTVSPLPAASDNTIHPGVDTSYSGYSYLFAGSAGGSLSWIGRPSSLLRNDPQPAQAGVGLSADGNVAAYVDPNQLTADAPPYDTIGRVFMTRGGTTSFIGKAPDGNPLSGNATVLGVSDDGDAVLMLAADDRPGSFDQALYLYRPGGVIKVSASQATSPASTGRLGFGGRLARDGGSVVFDTAEALLDADTDTSTDVYRYNVQAATLTLLSDGASGAGQSDACSPISGATQCDTSPGLVSADGQTVYFVSPDQLVAGKGQADAPNIYVTRGSGPPTYVTTLDAGNALASTAFGAQQVPGQALEANGDLLIESAASLVAGVSQGSTTQIYRYDRVADKLTCVSCRGDGGASSGSAYLGARQPDVQGLRQEDQDGSVVVFSTTDRLSTGDRDDNVDVYAYDTAAGRHRLITDFVSTADAEFKGMDSAGDLIVFGTRDTLDWRDKNGGVTKVYGSLAGGGAPPEPATRPGCSGDACRTAAPTPDRVSTSTLTARPEVAAPPLNKLRSSVSASARRSLANGGVFRVRVTGLERGSQVKVRTTLQLSKKVQISARGEVIADASSEVVVLRFTARQRAAFRATLRRRSVRVRTTAGTDRNQDDVSASFTQKRSKGLK